MERTFAVELRHSVLCLQRCTAGCRSVIEINCMTESTWVGPQTWTAGPLYTSHSSEHLFTRWKSIISPPNLKTGCSCSRFGWCTVAFSLTFCNRALFGSWPPHCVIEKPASCHYTSAVWLPGRASASSSGPARNSLRQAVAGCLETENPWLAENNKYPWEAARWTFTVSLAGEGRICQTSH